METHKKPDPTINKGDVLPPPKARKNNKIETLDKALAICASSANPDDYEQLERIFMVVKSRIHTV